MKIRFSKDPDRYLDNAFHRYAESDPEQAESLINQVVVAQNYILKHYGYIFNIGNYIEYEATEMGGINSFINQETADIYSKLQTRGAMVLSPSSHKFCALELAKIYTMADFDDVAEEAHIPERFLQSLQALKGPILLKESNRLYYRLISGFGHDKVWSFFEGHIDAIFVPSKNQIATFACELVYYEFERDASLVQENLTALFPSLDVSLVQFSSWMNSVRRAVLSDYIHSLIRASLQDRCPPAAEK